MINPKIKRQKKERRHKRIRAKVSGTAERPRLCVFCSNKHTYAQLIDDEKGKTIVSAKDTELSASPKAKAGKEKKQLTGKIAIAFQVGKLIAEKTIKNKINKVVFDRGGYIYHGRVKALAEGAREGGLIF